VDRARERSRPSEPGHTSILPEDVCPRILHRTPASLLLAGARRSFQ
jgi:hypothetical protein